LGEQAIVNGWCLNDIVSLTPSYPDATVRPGQLEVISSRPGRVAGKVAIVTGGGSRGPGIGTGRAAAILLAREGARVALVDVDQAAAEQTHRMISEEGGESMVLEGDVTDRASCAAVAERALAAWSRIDILVNNVGISGSRATAVGLDVEAWDNVMRVNLTSMVLMAGSVIPAMTANGGGSIVNISSTAALYGGSPLLAYATSKTAVIGLTRTMAAQHGQDGIRVNAIAPGFVRTPMATAGVGGDDPATWETRRLNTLLKTAGTGWDVGYAVLFFASEESRWVTGAILPVDAGYTSGRDAPQPA
jgi:NAD(P)-dependent dehydrogenase (short-subunit alcohol dehydrogenase family)